MAIHIKDKNVIFDIIHLNIYFNILGGRAISNLFCYIYLIVSKYGVL